MSNAFSLTPSNLKGDDPNQYVAVVQSVGTLSYEQIIDLAVKQNTTVTRPDTLAAMDNICTVIEDALLLGFNVNTPLVNLRVKIKGNFEGDSDTFDPARHKIKASISPGKRLSQAMQRATAHKQESGANQPRPLNYTDLNSGALNGLITPGGIGRISGHRLKFDPTDPEQGIFFINGSITRMEVIAKNSPSELTFLVSAGLTPGEYSLEVRTATRHGTLRTGSLGRVLTVG